MYQIRILLFLIFIIGCAQKNTDQKSKKGEDMAQVYCSSCHQFPDPKELTKDIWINKIMPNMATRMGFKWGFPYKGLDVDEIKAIMDTGLFPDKPVISEEMMLRIVKYYENNSPKKSEPQKRAIKPDTNLTLFAYKSRKINAISNQNLLLKSFSDKSKILRSFEDKGTWIYDLKSQKNTFLSPIVASDAQSFNQNLYLLNLVKTQAYNIPKGCIYVFPWKNEQPEKTSKVLIDSLIRPVNMDIADINKDGKPDFIVCEFGDYLGRLTLHISENGAYKRIVLKDYPGAIKAKFTDINNDGKLDLVVLMTQAKEELLVYLDIAKLDKATEISIAKYPPNYGTNNMEIEDINKDGSLDIIVTNGDNADISSMLKSYHGLKIYLGDNKGNFKLAWFYPVYGVSNVVIADFDSDGKKDMAVISHFPDFKNKNFENFLFFKNMGKTSFKPFIFPKPINGRLLTIEKMDVDSDGDLDILVGNYLDNLTDPGGSIYHNWSKEKRDMWILENNSPKTNKKL